MVGEIELVRANIHEPNNPVLIDYEGRGSSDVVGVNSQSVMHAVALDDITVFVRQQRKCYAVSIGILSHLPRPLTNNADNRGLERRVLVRMFLQTRQLAAAVGSPRSPEEHQQDALFTRIRFEAHLLLTNGAQCERRRDIPNLERFISSRHNPLTGNLRKLRWLGKALASLTGDSRCPTPTDSRRSLY